MTAEIQLYGGPADGHKQPYQPGVDEVLIAPGTGVDPAGERDVAVYTVVDCGCAQHEAKALFSGFERRRGPATA